MSDSTKLLRRAERAIRSRKQAEQLLEEKSLELFETNRQLQELAQSLESKVQQRTKELDKKSKLALAATEAKSEFLATMSHEIRTPLNGVLGTLELLSGTTLDDEQHDYASTARSSAESLLSIINDILDFSKIEAGKLELDFVDFNVIELIEESILSIATLAHNKGLEIYSDIHVNVEEWQRGDPIRIRQVLINLLSNAIKFCSEGEVTVTVSQTDTTNGNSILSVRVRDTGVGIASDKLDRIFKPFSQADGSTTRNFGGTGLGLSICSKLVDLMNGNIGVESEIDVGSTFWFTAELIPTETSIIKSGHIINAHVLIVDDNSVNQKIFSTLLGKWHATYEIAATGFEALDLLNTTQTDRSCRFDIAIVDGQMPGMSGADLIRSIKSDSAFDDLKIIFCSSLTYAAPTGVNQLVHRTLQKPVRQKYLLNTLRALTENTEPSRKVDPEATLLAEPAPHNQKNDRKRLAGHVLLVEDNPTNQKVQAAMLKKMGLSVDCVNNGAEALDVIQNQTTHFDCILMDAQMPVMDGIESTRQIREWEKTHRTSDPKVPIIALTANAMGGDRERYIEAGMDDYVAKPVAQDALRIAPSQWLNQVISTDVRAIDPELKNIA